MTKPLPNLPNPFLDSQVGLRSPLRGRFAARPALVVFLLCMLLGLVTVGWRAKRRADDARGRAGAEALARGTALELQFNQALAAAEVLGALARQSGGTIPNFQKVAAELLAARPGVASLEVQPNGVVSDIAPRAGNERAIGFNVLNDPASRPGASAAIQKRALIVTGPLTLYRGDSGIVVRVPVFPRGRDGRDYFWGFVAASTRLSEALRRARVEELVRQGYNYVLFAPASAKETAVTIAAHGALSVQEAVQQPVRAHDLEFRLAVQPRGGWISKTKVVLEALGVLAASGLLCLLVNQMESRRAVEAALEEANQRLERETADRKQAQEDCRNANDKAAAARAELDRARSTLQSNGELETRLNASMRAADEEAQARQAELEQARTGLQQAEQTINSLQARLDAAARTEKKAAAALQTRLETAQATIADLEVRLEGATRLAQEAAEARTSLAVPTENACQESSAPPAEADAVTSITPPTASTFPTPITSPVPDSPESPMAEVTSAESTPPPLQPPAERKPIRAARRKKTRRDDQMDLFATQPAADQSLAGPAANAVAEEAAVETPSPPIAEPPALSGAAAPDEPEKPVADAREQTLAAPVITPKPKEERPGKPLPPSPPMHPAELRKAVNLILPLFTGQDPGARDCLKANRATFRSAFTPEAYVEFEQTVKSGDFNAALEQLKKAARKHGIPA
jgi:sensor domain CHASE-containing protein